MKKMNIPCFALYFFIFIHLACTADTFFRLGIEDIPDDFLQKIKNARIGLITNQTGKDSQGQRTVDILRSKGLHIKAILAPEHGFDGTILAGEKVPDSYDEKTGIPIISLYDEGDGKNISKKTIIDLDIIMFDIQDSGMRHYTYISTLLKTLDTAAQYDKSYIVLDRPNPLGWIMEGPLVDVTLQSFISIAPIPLRHAMTVGELAWFFNAHILKQPAKLHVVRMKGYTRTAGLQKTSFYTLSPNLASLPSCYGYSFLGLLGEIQPFDVGIGTNKAFQVILLPENINFSEKGWNNIKNILQKHGIQSSLYQTYNAGKKKQFRGLQIQINEINKVDSFTVLLDVLQSFKKDGIRLSFSRLFDKAVGTRKIRTYLKSNRHRKSLTDRINTNLDDFLKKAQSCLMYEPTPKIVMLDN